MQDLSFFLGGNTYQGFYSLYEEYLKSNEGSRVWILKGGAGCGKSGFMRRVYDRVSSAGYMVHRILCSGDPSSLDGIHIPALGVILLDGTAPHVLEPPFVGDRGFYLNMSRFYRPGVPDLRILEEAYGKHYKRAYRWLAAAGHAEASLELPAEAEKIIRRKAAALIARELRTKGRNPQKPMRVFVDAFCCEGMLTLHETQAKMAQHQIGLCGICGAEHVFLSSAAEAALARGYEIVISPSPLQPERIAHLFIPECDLGIGIGKGDRYIHLDKIVYNQADAEFSELVRETDSMRTALLSKAHKELALARHDHDNLEKAVNPYVDFSGVYEEAEAFAGKLLNDAPPESMSV